MSEEFVTPKQVAERPLIPWEQCDFNLGAGRNVWNLPGAGYFKYVVSMAALARNEMERSDSVCPKSIYTAHLEQEVLFWFIYFCAANPKMLSDWNRFADVHIQSTFVETLPRGSFEDFGILPHTTREILHPLRLRTN